MEGCRRKGGGVGQGEQLLFSGKLFPVIFERKRAPKACIYALSVCHMCVKCMCMLSVYARYVRVCVVRVRGFCRGQPWDPEDVKRVT